MTITMTSPNLHGEIVFTFNPTGHIQSILFTGELSHKQYQFILPIIPWHISQVPDLAAAIPSATFVERTLEVTFDMFWKAYSDKDRSSRKKTEKKWNSMPVTERARAYYFIPSYTRNRGSADKKYATTYLNDELWNN